MAAPKSVVSAILVALIAAFYGPAVHRSLTVLGVLRKPTNTLVADESNIGLIRDTTHCEDLHHHLPSNKLFAACEDSDTLRLSWFPPLASFDPLPTTKSQGSIHVIDPQSHKSQRLKFENFDGAFVTHGIDVISDPENPQAVYVFAVNHLPHPDYLQQVQENSPNATVNPQKARSQLEAFYHVLGSSTIKHIRSIRHPLIQTPNDILALSPTSLYVTNDHHYKEGLMRMIEDGYSGAKWTTIAHVKISDLSEANKDPESDIDVNLAHTRLHNNNGLGRGRSDDEILIDSAASGVVHVAKLSGSKEAPDFQIIGDVQLDAAADNPSYYSDPYATPDNDASGFVISGVSSGYNLANTIHDPEGKDPSITWLVKPGSGPTSTWEKKVLFEDDGTRIRSSSSAVLVGIDPETEGGSKKAWLFVTGFFSRNMIAVKVDL